jgi:hypothetical protein
MIDKITEFMVKMEDWLKINDKNNVRLKYFV